MFRKKWQQKTFFFLFFLKLINPIGCKEKKKGFKINLYFYILLIFFSSSLQTIQVLDKLRIIKNKNLFIMRKITDLLSWRKVEEFQK